MSPISSLHSILDRFNTCHVAVIGDVMLDCFVYGDVKRISPESPVPVLNVRKTDYMLGGAGNVLANLSGLGVSVSLFGIVGDDKEGMLITDLVNEGGKNSSHLEVDTQRPTTVKTRYLSGNQQLIRVDSEKTDPLSEDVKKIVFEELKSNIKNMNAVILSDYGKGVLDDDMIKRLINLAHEADIPVLVDPKGHDYTPYKNATVITPNLNELEVALGHGFSRDDHGVIAAASELIERTGVKAVLATRSQDGMTIVEANKETQAVHLRNQALEVYDVSGAGDTVIAALAAGLASEASLEDSADIANYAGGVVVGKVGTSPIRLDELSSAIETQGQSSSQLRRRKKPGYVGNWDEAKEAVQRWKRKGFRVGFTNGCFDILHEGHTQYLQMARESCDRLVLGLNSDLSVARLKGEGRPVNPQDARANVLSALQSVDLVVLFGDQDSEDDKPIDVIRYLEPDILFKGGDYKEEDLPEAPVVRSYGGDVKLMSFTEGVSTTATIDKIKTKAS